MRVFTLARVNIDLFNRERSSIVKRLIKAKHDLHSNRPVASSVVSDLESQLSSRL